MNIVTACISIRKKRINSISLKLFPLILVCFLIVAHVEAQRITFCEKVDSKGNAVNTSSTFSISRGGGYLYFLVKLPKEVGHSSVIYDLFWLDKDGKEHYDNTVKQNVEPSWSGFWKEIDFLHPGNYRVYVYNDYDQFLCV